MEGGFVEAQRGETPLLAPEQHMGAMALRQANRSPDGVEQRCLPGGNRFLTRQA